MKTSRAFTPAVSDTLETRCVPSTFGFHALHGATIAPQASGPVTIVHPPGTFSQGNLPGVFEGPNGTFTLR